MTTRLGETGENAKLGAGEINQVVAHHDALATQVDVEGADREDVTPRAASRLAVGATQDRTHAGAQFARIEGLGEIVVGAELETENAIDGVAPRRQHQHRQPRV